MFGKNLKALTDHYQHGNGAPAAGLFAPRRQHGQLVQATPENLATFLELEIAAAEALQHQAATAALKKAISTPPIVEFIETSCVNPETVNVVTKDFTKAEAIRLAPHQKRILNHVLTIDPRTGRFPYRTIVYSAPKKSGKTAVSWFVGAWFGLHIEPPNAIMVLGNKQDQADDRALAGMTPTLLLQGARPSANKLVLPNGTLIRALPNDPSTEAGGSYGLTLWTELWGFTTDRDRKLWAEMMPVNTRQNSLRWVETYAGYEDASDLLLSLFLQVFTDVSERQLQAGARAVPELEDIRTTDSDGNSIPTCYEVPATGLFYYNDHEHRMPWQTGEHAEAYYREITVGLTETDIVRLVFNRWQASQNAFANDEQKQASFANGDDLPRAARAVYAIDASKTTAGTALVGMVDQSAADGTTRYRTVHAKVWYPAAPVAGAAVEIDLERTVADAVVALFRRGLIEKREPTTKEKHYVEHDGCTPIAVYYDPYQMAQIAINLRKNHKLLIAEFSQKTERLLADTFLQKQYQNGKVDNPAGDADFKAHLDAANAQAAPDTDGTSRIRIVAGTGTHAKPVDLIVAQSMATWRLSQRPKPQRGLGLGQGIATGW